MPKAKGLGDPLPRTQYANVSVEVVATKAALAFYTKADVTCAGGRLWTDDDEWSVSGFRLMFIDVTDNA